MTREELRDNIAQRPNSVRFEELAQLLEAYGWELRRIHASHHIFGRGRDVLAVPLRRPHIFAVYVRRALKLLE